MKIQHIAIIFIIIMVPVLLVLQYYIDLQSDTLLLQAEYDEKLVSATKQALEAFEINTVEWNSETSDLSDSLRRDITASVNVFVNSMANNLGIGGASREIILSYIPAVAFTLNDGYYIYTPTYVPITAKDENGLTEKNENGEILYKKKNSYTGETTTSVAYAQTEYKHVLKTFVPYQKQLGNYIFNFSLDNYVKVYAKVGLGESEEIIKRSGHYDNSLNIDDVKPEILTENILVNNDGTYNVENYQYVYDQHGEKVYYDGVEDKFFTLKLLDGSKNYLADTNSQEDIGYRYKTLLQIKEDSGNTEYKILYQGLNGNRKDLWYIDKNFDGYLSSSEEIYPNLSGNYGLNYDFSAINYYVETITFTNWIETIENDLNLTDKDEFKKIFDGGDLTTNSVKRKIIRESIETNLQLAMATYKNYSRNKYELPYFKEVEWERIYSNVSIITFFEGAPIGLKTYSNYAIETSTNNNVYVSEDCLYYQSENDDYYHKYLCDKIVSTNNDNIKAYKNIDYIMQNETYSDITKNYYKHTDYSDKDKISCACYYCLVSEAEYQPTNPNTYENARNLAIAREKYVNSVMLYDFNQEPTEDINNPYSEFRYQIYLDEEIVMGTNTIQDVFTYTNSNVNNNFVVRIKNNLSGTFVDNTIISKTGDNTVTIDFFSNRSINQISFVNDEDQAKIQGGTIDIKINGSQEIFINSEVYVSSTLNVTGEGKIDTGKIILNGGTVTAENTTKWNIREGINKTGGNLKINMAQISVDYNNSIVSNYFLSNAGEWNFDSNGLSANGGSHRIDIKTFKSDKKLNCKANTTLEVFANQGTDNKFEINNDISNNGTISINDNIDIKVGNIENNNTFNIGLGTGAEGKVFNCGEITNNGTLNIKNTGDFSFTRDLTNNHIMTISNKGKVEELNEKDGIWNSGELTINNIGNIKVCYFANKKICSLKNNGNIIIPKIVNDTTESLTLANTGYITLEEQINNNQGTLNIEGAKTITGNSENIIMANAGSRINIEPGKDKTIDFVNNTISGRVLTMYSASEEANTSTTWSTDRTIVNIKNGKITSNVSGILQYGGQLNISDAELVNSGGTYIVQAGLQGTNKTYPRITIDNSTLNFNVSNETCSALKIGAGTILQMTKSTVVSNSNGLQTMLLPGEGTTLNQIPSGYTEDNWYKSANNNKIVIKNRTEMPIIAIKGSKIESPQYSIQHIIGYIQIESSEIKNDVSISCYGNSFVETRLQYDKASEKFNYFYNGQKNPAVSSGPGGNAIACNASGKNIYTSSVSEFPNKLLTLPIDH